MPHPLARFVTWLLLFVAAGYAGRATIIDDRALSLVWPAAGVAALWVCSATSVRERVADLAGIAGATFVVNASTGAPAQLAGVFVVANLIQALLFLVLMHRLSPHLWGFGGRETLRSLRDLATLLASSAAACLVAAAVGSAGLRWVTGTGSLETVAIWWGRNGTGLFTVGVLGLLALAPVLTAGSDRWLALRELVSACSRRRLVEGALITLGTGVLLFSVFLIDTEEPLAFLLLFATVMAGVRFAPLGAALHGLATGAVAILFTLGGRGPFAAVADLGDRALLAQVFVTMTVVTGLVLAFSRAERDRAYADLAAAADRIRHSEREAGDRANLFAAVLDHMREGVAVIQADGTVLVRNQAGRRLVGLEGPGGDRIQPAEAYGLFHPDGTRVTEGELPYVHALAGTTVEGEDFHVRTQDAPEGRVLEISADPMPGPDPEHPMRALVMFRDVTAQRQERDSLASFAGVVAHDLTNPLTGLRGWAQLLQDALSAGDLDPREGLAMVGRIQSSADLMDQFIKDLLSYTLSRDTRLTIGSVDVTAIAREVASLRSAADLRPQIEVQDGLRVEADAMLVRQLMDNLIGNAIKYVAPGVRPRIEVSAVQSDGWLEVSVRDNGIGVPDEMRQRIFENFQRAHAEDYRGTGIGLAICRRVVRRHGGRLFVEPGGVDGVHGSRFVFTLPMAIGPGDCAGWSTVAIAPVESASLRV